MEKFIRQILKEEIDKNSMDDRVLNFLKRHFELGKRDLSLGEDEKPLIVKIMSFNVGGDWYLLNSFMSKKEMTLRVYNMLEENSVVSLGEYDPNVLDTDRQKVVRTIKYFLDNTILKKD